MEKYFNLGEESIESIIEHLESESWGGAKDRISSATEEQIEQVAETLKELFGDEYITETTINDFVWFDCDNIFEDDEDEEDDEEETEE